MSVYTLRIILFSPFVFSFLYSSAQSQQGSISGYIQSENEKPIANITISLEGTTYGTLTSEAGHFTIKSLPIGSYTLVISGVGYEVGKQTVIVKAGEKTIVSYQLNSKTSELSEVVVTTDRGQNFTTVTKIDVPVGDIPVTTSSVGSKTIEQRAVDDLGEAMKNTTGVRANNTYGGFQHFTIRGFSNFVLLVDGVRDERHNISTSAPNTNLANVERIDVLKGPASVLFGHSALGGIINIVRKKPSEGFKANFSATYGSFNTRRMRIGAGGPITSKLRYRIDAGLSETEGYRHMGTSTNNVYLAMEYTPSAKDYFLFTIGANKDVYDTDTGIPMLEGSVLAPGMDVNTRYNDPADFLKHTRSDFQFRYVRQLGTRLQISNHLSYYDDNINYLSTEELSFNSTLDSLTRTSPLYFNHLTKPWQNQLEATYNFRAGAIEQKVLLGYSVSILDRKTYNGVISGPAQYAQIAVRNPILNQGFLSYADSRYRASQETVHGFYLQDWLKFSEKLKALVGLRYDIFQGTYFTNLVDQSRNVTEEGVKTRIAVSALTYRAGLVYQPMQPLSVYSSFSTYFKPSRRIAPNGETFDPETGYQAEIGSRYELMSLLSASVSVYYMRKDNQVESLAGGVYKRVGSVDSKGFEIELQSNFTPGLDLTLGYTYTDARYLPFAKGEVNLVANNKAVLAPDHMLNLWTHYEWTKTKLRGISIGAGANYMSKTFTNSTNTYVLVGYTVVDATLGYRIGKVALQMNINNILNERYFNNAIISNQFYPGTTRNYLLSLKYSI